MLKFFLNFSALPLGLLKGKAQGEHDPEAYWHKRKIPGRTGLPSVCATAGDGAGSIRAGACLEKLREDPAPEVRWPAYICDARPQWPEVNQTPEKSPGGGKIKSPEKWTENKNKSPEKWTVRKIKSPIKGTMNKIKVQ